MSAPYKLQYTFASCDDLESIREYIADVLASPTSASRQVTHIKDAARGLKTLPLRYGKVDFEPWHSLGVRRFTVDNYVVFYQVDSGNHAVVILRVLYGGRDIREIALER